MTLAPFPIPTRICHGEDIDSYSRRHAARNRCEPTDVEHVLRERGILASKRRGDPDRLEAWRCLGGLHHAAFTAPQRVADDTVTTRSLCRRCTNGEPARGLVPDIGMVCIRHRRWLGPPQIDLHGYYPALVAERRFRSELAHRAVMHDSLPMLVGRECASPAIIGGDEIQRRREETGIHHTSVLIYPEQVGFARLITRRRFLHAVTDPDVGSVHRRSLVTDEVAKIVPGHGEGETWRAVDRVWTVVARLTTLRRDAHIYRTPIRDTHYNILRLI